MSLRLRVHVAFAFVAVAMAACAIAWDRPERFDQVDLVNLPELDYCVLRTTPDHYDGKVVKIRGELGWFLHGSFFL